ncbi:50S ribosomal protein L18 [Fulvivirga maritima]|uniref:50S ribosomal protein L18 n=1 Tax=Fulvivirga maritima TaxID=2904247 RepID=UPI001F35AAC2|nr:50S ribosomal protein L18 [Fulvivirga maritima]UII28884.1 50S ribosomal protein L18 [Fulvivirga maritima]
MALNKHKRRLRIKKGIRNKISGTAEKPRLSVFKSNKGIYAQLIDDTKGHTLLASSSKDIDGEGLNVDVSKNVGLKLAEKAKADGIEKIVFDRSGYLYHGRVKALAEGAREGGLKF